MYAMYIYILYLQVCVLHTVNKVKIKTFVQTVTIKNTYFLEG